MTQPLSEQLSLGGEGLPDLRLQLSLLVWALGSSVLGSALPMIKDGGLPLLCCPTLIPSAHSLLMWIRSFAGSPPQGPSVRACYSPCPQASMILHPPQPQAWTLEDGIASR